MAFAISLILTNINCQILGRNIGLTIKIRNMMSHATKLASSLPLVPRDNPRIMDTITHNNKYGKIFFSKADIANFYSLLKAD